MSSYITPQILNSILREGADEPEVDIAKWAENWCRDFESAVPDVVRAAPRNKGIVRRAMDWCKKHLGLLNEGLLTEESFMDKARSFLVGVLKFPEMVLKLFDIAFNLATFLFRHMAGYKEGKKAQELKTVLTFFTGLGGARGTLTQGLGTATLTVFAKTLGVLMLLGACQAILGGKLDTAGPVRKLRQWLNAGRENPNDIEVTSAGAKVDESAAARKTPINRKI